jgi:hypothetical protein
MPQRIGFRPKNSEPGTETAAPITTAPAASWSIRSPRPPPACRESNQFPATPPKIIATNKRNKAAPHRQPRPTHAPCFTSETSTPFVNSDPPITGRGFINSFDARKLKQPVFFRKADEKPRSAPEFRTENHPAAPCSPSRPRERPGDVTCRHRPAYSFSRTPPPP